MCKGLAALPQTCLERAKEIKTKLGVLLQKPENAIDLIIPYPEKTEKKPEKLQKPSPEEAAQWRESLDRVLNNSYGLNAFRSFLQSEFSDENIEFWMSCEEFKKTKNPIKMAAKAKKIYEDFIQSEGPREVRDSCDFPLFYELNSTWNRKRSSHLIRHSGLYMITNSLSLI
uniref:Regulator of G protein signaling 5a n=1 Tax=Dicentrarchus labrax TaxID=13489 RepID=A0A8C4H3C0_DICLA